MQYNPLTATDGIMAAVRAHDEAGAKESAAAEDEDADADKPGRWVCSDCGSDNLTFSADVRWDAGAQDWEIVSAGDEKPYCQRCECRTGWAEFVPLRDTRAEPQLSRDYYGDLFIVIDDDGEPVSDYKLTLKAAREYREDHGGKALAYRIAKVPYKALPRDDGEPDEIADDPAGREAS